MDVRVGLSRKLSTEELMLLNFGVGEAPGSQASSRGEAKDSAIPSSRDAGLLEPPERPQGSPASSSVCGCPGGSTLKPLHLQCSSFYFLLTAVSACISKKHSLESFGETWSHKVPASAFCRSSSLSVSCFVFFCRIRKLPEAKTTMGESLSRV